MAGRVCNVPGCAVITTGPKCPAHTPTKAERGYGYPHQRERAKWQRIISHTGWPCARCETRIQPGDDWHLDHDDDRDTWLGPSHAHCNLSAAGKKSHQQ